MTLPTIRGVLPSFIAVFARTQIPASAGSLVALTDLKASQNRFTAIHPDAAAGWGQMSVLNLNRNQLTSLPKTAAAWVELKSIDLRANKLTALDEESLGAWTKLEVSLLSMCFEE